MAFDLETCRSKDELESFARQMFNVELDKRKKLDELKDEVRQLMNGGEALRFSRNEPHGQIEPDQPAPSAQRTRKKLRFVLNNNKQRGISSTTRKAEETDWRGPGVLRSTGQSVLQAVE